MCERELETEQNCNILTPTLLAITAFLSHSPGLLNWGPGGPLCWVLVFSTASYLQLIWSPTAQMGVPRAPSAGCCFLYSIIFWSPTRLISNCNSSIEGLRAHSAGCWHSLPHLVSNWSDLQTSLSYMIVQCPPSSCGRHNFALIQPVHGQGYNPDRLDAPVIYTGAFPILTARSGCRSICNITTLQQPSTNKAENTEFEAKKTVLWRSFFFYWNKVYSKPATVWYPTKGRQVLKWIKMCILKGYIDMNFLCVFVLKCFTSSMHVYYFLCSEKFCIEKSIWICQSLNFMEWKLLVPFWLKSVFLWLVSYSLFILCQGKMYIMSIQIYAVHNQQ